MSNGELVSLSAVYDRPVYAFCGVGNPEAFFADLEKWDFSVSSKEMFRDHCDYYKTYSFVLRLFGRRKAAAAFVTTEKDAMKLPKLEKTELPILACVIQTEMAEARAFEEALFERLGAVKVSA